MNRTFRGFLERYCRELSGLETSSLRRLVAAADENARLIEPLFAFAVAEGKLDHLLRISKGKWYDEEYQHLASLLSEEPSLEALLASGKVPQRYAAVLDAYRAQGDILAADRRMNGLMREKIMRALKQKGMKRYQLCRDLGLNFGNVYAYLAGDDSKVSNVTARRMLRYVEEARA